MDGRRGVSPWSAVLRRMNAGTALPSFLIQGWLLAFLLADIASWIASYSE